MRAAIVGRVIVVAVAATAAQAYASAAGPSSRSTAAVAPIAGGLDEVAERQHAGRSVAISEHGRERGEERRRDHLDEGDEAGSGRAALP